MPDRRIAIPDIAGAFYRGRDRRQRNMLLQRAIEQEDADLARQEQTRNLLAEYTMPGASPEERAANLNRLMAVNPDAAMSAQTHTNRQAEFAREKAASERVEKVRNAQVMVRRMQRVLSSPHPEISLQLNRKFPQGDIVEQLAKDGIVDTTNGIDAEEARRIAQYTLDQVAPIAGNIYEDAPAGVQEFRFLTQGFSPEQQRQAREVATGIRSRAGTSRVLDVGNVPTLVTNAGGTPTAAPVSTIEAEQAGETAIAGANQLGQTGIKRFDTMFEKASSASSSLRAIRQGAQLIGEGIITGSAAGGRNAIARVLDTLLGRQTDESALSANTDAYLANAGQLVAERITAFGAGTGLSDQDRKFAERMAGGDVSMTEAALKRILELNYKAAKGSIDKYNKRYEKLAEQYADVRSLYDKFDVPDFAEIAPWKDEPPAGDVPEGVDPAVWNVMTPEERALWQ